jgi:ribosomal RNA-processing protein 1
LDYNDSRLSFLTFFFVGRLAGFWMTDKPVRQALASELADIILTITPISSSLDLLRGFWELAFREWSGIDRLRCVLLIHQVSRSQVIV